MNQSKVDVLLGLQWGDEGKGKVVDYITKKYDIVARFQGGPNAGHTLMFEDEKHVLHTIPSGIFHKETTNIIGNGVVIDPVIFSKEISNLKQVDAKKSLLISSKAHIILPTHKLLDLASEKHKGKGKIGSTLKGISPTYMDKTGRNGIRVTDLYSDNFRTKYNALKEKHLFLLNSYNVGVEFDSKLEIEFFEAVELLKQFCTIDSLYYINNAITKGKKILAEGAQGTLLDIEFGSYPFVTSSNTIAAGACTGLGIAPNKIGNVFGIFKAYCTRVGSGPFPTELFDENGKNMQQIGCEFGATTGRERRCGWLDLVALKYACIVNGVTHLIMMKVDVLDSFKQIKLATSYKNKNGEQVEEFSSNLEDITPVYKTFKGWNTDSKQIKDFKDLPINMKQYITFIENYIGVPIVLISYGPKRNETVISESLKTI